MAESFGIPHIVSYLHQMDIKIAQLDQEQQTIELTFQGERGQWRMIIGIQQSGSVSKLILIAPHVGTITQQKRLECLEALMSVNYRIAIGKFGLDLEDGEVRLEECIPLANNTLTLEQFRLAFNALIQTVSIYHSLLPRIVYGNLPVQEALSTCEQEFFKKSTQNRSINTPENATRITGPLDPQRSHNAQAGHTEFDIDEILAEVTRLLDGDKEA